MNCFIKGMASRWISNSINLFVVSALVGCGAAYAEPVSVNSYSIPVPSPRVEHARELLGRHYKKTLKTADQRNDVTAFVRQITKSSLGKKWKKSASRISRAILEESKRHGFDPIFLVSVIQTESSFSPTARGTSGEIGLMQLRPETGKWIAQEFDLPWKGKKTLYDPVANIRLGSAYLSLLREKFGKDGRLYIPAYNMGPSRLKDSVAQRIFPIDYARRVMKKYLRNYSRISKLVEQERASREAIRREHERRLSADRARQLAKAKAPEES